MPTKRLPPRPSLEHLKRQARDLRDDHAAARRDAFQRVREFHPRFAAAADDRIAAAPFTLSDAYLTVAREYGFKSWARLRNHLAAPDRAALDRPHHERIDDEPFRHAVALIDDGDLEGLRAHLSQHPRLVHQRVRFEGRNYFSEPSLLEFVAENPIRHDSLPPNIVEIARLLLDTDARSDRAAVDATLELVSSGRVARECGVQLPLIDLLCDYPGRAMLAALVHGEFQAAEALVRRGAPRDVVAAAATGRLDETRRGLAGADRDARHRALALAAQHGHADVVRLLLDAGEDPNRYNPVGCHAHATPLHQAALAGHLPVVVLLVERGAARETRDILFEGTPAEWAEHGGHGEVAAYLRTPSTGT